ncbi:HAMP domain-containing sensor histidine kinase [Alkalimarinus alittae]|uniref:histidine kinase n=1 Tax=Alkalimarinus alittae TaxID=2961619 RepID=A0ABY6N3V9_9ALTE|nr:ATP-binding protein [Alkalimarinus alittae]UZE96664.1 ATP-binding protein [Alkalimarinus alittae]
MNNHPTNRPSTKNRYTLFLKIMGVFWATLLLTTIANITITSQISNIEHKAEKVQSKIESLANDGVTVYETSGEKALNKWYKRIYEDDEIRAVLYLVSSDDRVLKREKLGRPVASSRHRDKDVKDVKDVKDDNDHQKDDHYRTNKYLEKRGDRKHFDVPLLPIKTRISVISHNGAHYQLKVLPSPYIHKELRSPKEYRWLRLLITLGIILIASLWLSRHVVKPVITLKQASQKMAAGELSTRVGSSIGNRKDELGQLATSFDEMAKQLEKTITGQKQLLRDISHEIRTPLTRQRIAIDLVRTLVEDNPSSASLLDKIESQNNKLNELIENLLTLNRLNDGASQLSIEPVDLTPLIRELLEDAEIEASIKKITLMQQGLESVVVNGNRTLLARAFENIVGNTLKYSPENAIVSVDISTADNGVIVEITDQGPGLSEEEIRQVFTPFYRADNSRTQSTGGYGLGLSIVKQVVDLHDGKVKLYSPEEGGLCVRVYLPLPS